MEQIAGAAVTVLALLDVLMTVLYARAGTGIFQPRVSRVLWWLFRSMSKPFGKRRGTVLSFCGPVILVVLVLFWGLMLAVGSALVIHPHLGSDVRTSNGKTPTDFMSAVYGGGSSLAFVGTSDMKPQSGPMQGYYLFNSLVGMSVMSLVLTYVMQIYSALKTRKTFGLKVHTLSDETDDAAELIAGLGARGNFDAGFSDLSNMASDMAAMKESHHFYPVLFYFRFAEAYYSVSQTATMVLDTVSLLKSGIDDDEYGWVKESAVVVQAWRASMLLIDLLDSVFLAGAGLDVRADDAARERWQRRYFSALERFRTSGITTYPDPEAGANIYVRLREQWDRKLARLAVSMLYDPEEIDPATYNPELARARAPFENRLHQVR